MTRNACNLNPIPIPFPTPLLMLVSALLAAALVVSPRLHAADARHSDAGHSTVKHSLTIDCDKRHVSQRQAGWLLGTDNFSQTYDRRAALYAEVARACATGVAAVRVEGKPANASVAQWSRR